MNRLRRVLNVLEDFRNGDKRLSFLKEVETLCNQNPGEIESHQWNRLKSIVEFAYESIPFYRDRFDKEGIAAEKLQSMEDFRRIPLLTREDIRKYPEALISPGMNRKELFVSATGGATDSPIRIFLDRECLARRRAATLFFSRWFGYETGDPVAFLWGAAQDYEGAGRLRSKLKNWALGRSLFLSAGLLNDECETF
jgi:phenylacetate-CoA ligase